jgi:hypothetical protein
MGSVRIHKRRKVPKGSKRLMKDLNPQLARIFRIVHISNVPWILDHGGLHCQNSAEQDPNYVNIGNPSLIDKRTRLNVPIPPAGPLSDYVPFISHLSQSCCITSRLDIVELLDGITKTS